MTLEAKKSVSINKRVPSRGGRSTGAMRHPTQTRADRTPAPNLHRDKADHDCADDHRAGNRDAIGAAARPLIDVESGRIARIGIAYVAQHLVHGPDRTDDLLLEGARQIGGALTCCFNCFRFGAGARGSPYPCSGPFYHSSTSVRAVDTCIRASALAPSWSASSPAAGSRHRSARGFGRVTTPTAGRQARGLTARIRPDGIFGNHRG